jgi:hypothetical protein
VPDGLLDPLAAALDDTLTSWPEVRAKGVFGYRGYVRGRAMFAFLTPGGAAIKVLSEHERARLLAFEGAALFRYNDRPMKGWLVLPLASDSELDAIVQEARLTYEAVGG